MVYAILILLLWWALRNVPFIEIWETIRQLKGWLQRPRSETERKIAAIWQEVLRCERVGLEDDFFELGGHSLLATQIVSRVNKMFNIQLIL